MYIHSGARTNRLIILVSVVLSVYLSLPGYSQALTMPVYERLQSVDADLDIPTAVAIDSKERIYVAEASRNRLTVYSPSGDFIKRLSGLQKPISIAVDNSGRIFVGNKGTQNVEAYDFDLTPLFMLGSGDGEVERACAIATDADGNIYVADCGEDKIKVYNSDGTFNFSFGSPGAGNGQFNFPSSITIDRLKSEIIVSDHPLDFFGGYQGARIQIFNMFGGFGRSFIKKKSGSLGIKDGAGQLIKPMGAAVDEAGRIYVSDAYQNIVEVFDGNIGTDFGKYLGTVYDLNNPMRTPLGMAIGRSNRLLITSQKSSSVEIYGLDTFTQMDVTPLTLTYNAEEGGAVPALQDINITNNGNAVLNWTASSEDSWINLSAGSGATAVGATSSVYIGVATAGLTAGSYAGTVEVVSGKGVTETVDVTLIVTVPPPHLSVIPSYLVFTSINGTIPSPQVLAVNNPGGGTLNWNAAADSERISLDKSYGTAPDTINISIDITSLPAGTYYGAVTVSIDGTSDSAVIPVRLYILKQGTINVTTNLAEATFIINGPTLYIGRGTGWKAVDAPAGTYRIIYSDITGYKTPPSETATLQEGGTISFNGAYEAKWRPPAKNNIIVGAGPDENNNGTVRVFNAYGTLMELEFVAGTYMYGVNVASGDIDGDGVFEIITGAGPGRENPAEVNIYDKLGNHITGTVATLHKYGVNVASADFDGDRRYEVITGTGPDEVNPAEVKVFVYDSETQSLINSGIDLTASKGSKNGIHVSSGDMDGDGRPELIALKYSYEDGTTVRIWKLDTSNGKGNWSAALYKEFKVPQYKARVSIAGGDINGDGFDEIIAGVQALEKNIMIYDSNGTLIREFAIYPRYLFWKRSVNVVSGDMDGDGVAEIVVGSGPSEFNKGDVKVFDAYGNQIAGFNALNTKYGANVAVGDLGY